MASLHKLKRALHKNLNLEKSIFLPCISINMIITEPFIICTYITIGNPSNFFAMLQPIHWQSESSNLVISVLNPESIACQFS